MNKGRIGMPFQKMAHISEEIYKFLKLLCEDMGIDLVEGDWVALNFSNSSVCHDVKYMGDLETNQRDDFINTIEKIITNPKEAIGDKVRARTIIQYAKIAHPLEIDEFLEIGVYRAANDVPILHVLSRENADEVVETVSKTVEYYGAVRGIIENMYQLNSEKPYLKVRDLLSNKQIDCYFTPSRYGDVLRLLEKRGRLITFSGFIRANRLDRRIESINIDADGQMRLAEEYRSGDFEKFIGCSPGILGNMSIDEYMDDVRGRDA